jgi:hypothetical protein
MPSSSHVHASSSLEAVFSAEELEGFHSDGYILIREAFPKAKAEAMVDMLWARCGYDPEDPETWTEARIGMPAMHHVAVQDFAPRAWAGICQLMGGAERVVQPARWGDSFITQFGILPGECWQPPSPAVGGWHKDGDFFRHFLDSPEQGLLEIVFWTDVQPGGGATFVAFDSIPVVAQRLLGHPEGLLPAELNEAGMVRECRRFGELTGRAGDVALIHPYMLHTGSPNPLHCPRVITNPPMVFREPMRFDDPEQMSPVESAIMRALGVERLDFRPTSPREAVRPARMDRHEALVRQHQAILDTMPDYAGRLARSGWQA